MDESLLNKTFETFDGLDENELVLIINQVARRLLILRCDTPDASFWYGILMRVNRWLATTPFINEQEKQLLINPPTNITGRIRAIKMMRERSGANMSACMEIIDKWIKENLNQVHQTVRENFLTSVENRSKR